MKILFMLLAAMCWFKSSQSQELKPKELLAPDKTRGLPVMQAFSVKASVREYSEKPLSLQDLSDLVWAANGINRPDEGKRTASSALNAQDVDIYVFMEDGVYLYNAEKQKLDAVVTGDFRALAGKTDAPVTVVLISDVSRFRFGTDLQRTAWGNIDAGIVSQNISLFCAATGLKTCPKASFPGMDKIREILRLKNTQYVILNHPVGYEKE
jgi:nitroreductase